MLHPLQVLFKNSLLPSDKPRGWQQLKHSEAVWIGVCLRRGLLKWGLWLLSLWRGWLFSYRFCVGSALQMDCWNARRLFVLHYKLCLFPRFSICGCSPSSVSTTKQSPLPFWSVVLAFTCNATSALSLCQLLVIFLQRLIHKKYLLRE